jgi:hypothetical protein
MCKINRNKKRGCMGKESKEPVALQKTIYIRTGSRGREGSMA